MVYLGELKNILYKIFSFVNVREDLPMSGFCFKIPLRYSPDRVLHKNEQ
jgi:hypothetical protein